MQNFLAQHKKLVIFGTLVIGFIVATAFFGSLPVNAPIPAELGAARAKISPLAARLTACHVTDDGLPDPNCTPGALNPAITQTTLSQTLCNPKWSTKSIRPPTSYTTPLKKQSMVTYGQTDASQNYELDHLISLELGGAPKDPKNLWTEPYNITAGAHIKDHVENYLHKQICAGKMTLADAQNGIATDWVQYIEPLSKSINFGGTLSDPDDEE